jgi:hypothetical protein
MNDNAGPQSQNFYFQHKLLNELHVAHALFDEPEKFWKTKYVRLISHHNLLIVPLLSLCELKFDWQAREYVGDDVNAKAYMDAVSCLTAELRSSMPLAQGAATVA